MTAGRDFLLFLLFLIALGIVWFLTGGPGRTISHAGWFMNPPSPLGNGQGYNIPGVPFYSGSSTNFYAGQGSLSKSSNNTNSKQSLWDYFFNYRVGLGAAGTPPDSPYSQYVYFSQSSAQSSDPNTEYVSIQISQEVKNNITISGWSVEDAISGLRVPIGNAAQIPFLGQVNVEAPISAGPGSQIILVSGHSPNGTSFQLNECTGYFSQFQTFTPSLPTECPRPEDEMLRNPQTLAGNDACDNFVRDIRQCTLTLTPIPGMVGGLCQDFILNTLSYNGCITAHHNDPDFYRNEWRVYLNRDQELWKNNHDAIRLLDENGKLVAQVSY